MAYNVNTENSTVAVVYHVKYVKTDKGLALMLENFCQNEWTVI